jgi:HEAT repeat protein
LRRLLEDPNLNVQTQAIEALARQGRRQAIGEILRRFETSPEWYVQSYAYRALKELGWQPHTSR